MSIMIDSKLKPLYANLLRLEIGTYLISKNFNHLSIENNVDQLWDDCKSHVRNLSNVVVAIPGYTADVEDALGFFLTELYNSDKNLFFDILNKMLVDFLQWSKVKKDFNKVVENLIDLGYNRTDVEDVLTDSKNIMIEVPSEKKSIELQMNDIKIDDRLCFVLMPFDEKFNPLYENILKNVIENEEFGLNCKRADEIFGTRSIIEDMWEHIKKARILVAELSGRNPNVFYELGVAHAMNKDVILITQTLEDVPFDLRHYRCIVYEDSISGSEKLKRRIKKYFKRNNG